MAAVVRRCLVERLGIEQVGRSGHLREVDHTTLNAVVADGPSVDLKGPDGLLCRLCYGKRYPVLRYDPEAALGVEEAIIDGQRKSTPDLALEGQSPEDWGYPVAEAWAVYPGSHTTSPRPRNFTGGEFGLVPGEGAAAELAQWLEGVLGRVLS